MRANIVPPSSPRIVLPINPISILDYHNNNFNKQRWDMFIFFHNKRQTLKVLPTLNSDIAISSDYSYHGTKYEQE